MIVTDLEALRVCVAILNVYADRLNIIDGGQRTLYKGAQDFINQLERGYVPRPTQYDLVKRNESFP